MSVVALPLRQDARVFSFTTTLTDVDFTFEFFWNDQDRAWYFHINDAAANRLVSSAKVVLGALLAKRAGVAMPSGFLLAVDLSNQNREARVDDLGTRVKIFYAG